MSTSEQPDYSQYTHADLLHRVTDLEAQLRRLTASHSSSAPSPAPTLKNKKKPKRSPKPFDPSRYSTRLIALKFAYLGGNYNGFEHHANNTTPLPTIEEVLWKALRKTRLIFPEFAGRSESEVCWDGVEYSKCGRTDKGVSAFGQVIGVRVRSARPKKETRAETNGVRHDGGENAEDGVPEGAEDTADATANAAPCWDPIRDEMPYIALLNRVLPPDIRILAWCANPPSDFSARFNCKERRYRYFFTNPGSASAPGDSDGTLNVREMQKAAAKLQGLHDFRNFCKVDASKQITNFERRIFSAGVHRVDALHKSFTDTGLNGYKLSDPELYYFEVRGSAFLWHQVRHMVAVLFLVGQGYETPEVVDQLLDVASCPSKPVYDMADDQPLVLWDCIFPDAEQVVQADHQLTNGDSSTEYAGYEDAIEWVYVRDAAGVSEPIKQLYTKPDDRLFGRNGIMDDLWALWRKRKMDEVLAGSLMDVVVGLTSRKVPELPDDVPGWQLIQNCDPAELERSVRVIDGSERPRTVGKYVPVMQRERAEAPDVVNARYALRKGLVPRRVNGDAGGDGHVDE